MFIRVICVTCRRREFEHLPTICWAESGLFRWTFVDPSEDIDSVSLKEAKHIILDWLPDHIRLAQNIWTKILKEQPIAAPRVLHVADTPDVRVLPPRKNIQVFVRKQLEDEVHKWIDLAGNSARPTVVWDERDPYFQEIESLPSEIALIVEKYFPDASHRQARLDPVSGGHSGTPLIRLKVHNHSTPYVLKFFAAADEFEREWQAHENARQWLGDLVVPLHPVPEVARDAQAQSAVFRHENTPFFPICYRWADVTGLLKELYQNRDSDFARSAYQEVLHALATNQSEEDRRVDLRDLPFVGPPLETSEPHSCYEALRSSTYQRWFRTVRRELQRQGYKFFGGEKEWGQGIAAIIDTLDSTPPLWLTTDVVARFGRIHGDPNSRNLLFDYQAQTPSDLRFIDLGGFKADAPLVADLVFLEADIKFALLATEKDRTDYADWETNTLTTWRDVENEAIRSSLDFVPPALSDPSVARAYTIIGDIRRRAKEISPRDPEGRAYFLYLLFWSLRQIRSWSIPPTKRLFALYSASRICQRFSDWRGK